MDTTSRRLNALSRTMDEISQLEVEEMADGIGPRPLADQQLHLNMLRRRIQQQRSLVSKLSRDDLEDQYLHILEEQEVLKKEGNVKDDYIKKLSTKILRLQRSESGNRYGNSNLPTSLRAQMEQRIRSLENQLRVAKVYGAPVSMPRQGSRTDLATTTSSAENARLQSKISLLKQQLENLEDTRRNENEEHSKLVTELQAEVASLTEKIATENAKNVMVENMEVTRLSRQLAKTSQELLNLKNDFVETKGKLEEMQINKVVFSRDNERLKHDVERHMATIESMENQIRELREKSLQQIHDKERANRMETELEWYKRQQQNGHRAEAPVEQTVRLAENVLRNQIRTLEDELQREVRDNKEVRRRITERELELENTLRELSDLRSANLRLKQECEELKSRMDGRRESTPKESDGWFRAPPGYRRADLEQAFKLFDAFNTRRNISAATDSDEIEKLGLVRVPPELESQIAEMKRESERISNELKETKDELQRAERAAAERSDLQVVSRTEVKSGSNQRIAELQQKLDEKSRQLAQKNKIIDNLERHMREFAEETVVYDLEKEVVDQSRLSADTVNLQYGDNLLELHFGPFEFSDAFVAQAKKLRVSRWRLTWSVFGENIFSQDSEKSEPDFDFTAIHCITMDEQIMSDISEVLTGVSLLKYPEDSSAIILECLIEKLNNVDEIFIK